METLETSVWRLREKTDGLLIGMSMQSAFISHRSALDYFCDVIDSEVFVDTFISDIPWRSGNLP